MGVFNKLPVVVLPILIGFLVKFYWDISKPLPPPQFDVNQYWGAGDAKNYREDKSIRPFEILYPEKVKNEILMEFVNENSFLIIFDGTFVENFPIFIFHCCKFEFSTFGTFNIKCFSGIF